MVTWVPSGSRHSSIRWRIAGIWLRIASICGDKPRARSPTDSECIYQKSLTRVWEDNCPKRQAQAPDGRSSGQQLLASRTPDDGDEANNSLRAAMRSARYKASHATKRRRIFPTPTV